MKKENFVILAHARSGSTTLFNIFLSQGVNIFCEPFNHNSIMKYLIHWGKNDFESALDIILSEYKGFKHLFCFSTMEQTELIKSKCNTIFLYRENILDSAVSLVLAFKTNVWLHSDKHVDYEKEKVYIKPEEVQYSINHLNKLVKLKDESCYIVKYEDLYYSDKERQKKIIEEMFEFAGCEIIDYEKIERLLDVKGNKINPENWSDIISNWDEVEKFVNY